MTPEEAWAASPPPARTLEEARERTKAVLDATQAAMDAPPPERSGPRRPCMWDLDGDPR